MEGFCLQPSPAKRQKCDPLHPASILIAMVQTSGKKVSKISQYLHEFLNLIVFSGLVVGLVANATAFPTPFQIGLVSSPVNAAQGSTSNASREVGAVVAREADLRDVPCPHCPHPHPAHYRLNMGVSKNRGTPKSSIF